MYRLSVDPEAETPHTLSFQRPFSGSPHLGCWFQTRRHSRRYQSPHCPGALQPLFGTPRHSPKSGRKETRQWGSLRLEGTEDAGLRIWDPPLVWPFLIQLKTCSFCSRTRYRWRKHRTLEFRDPIWRDWLSKFLGTNSRAPIETIWKLYINNTD